MRLGNATNRGFTLIELMIVLILIGIFSALMVGEMRGTYEDALLRSTARKLIAAVNLANSKAVTLGRTYLLALDQDGNKLKIRAEGEADTVFDENLDSRISVQIRTSTLTTKSEEDPDNAPPQNNPSRRDSQNIRFLADGTTEPREMALRDRLGVELLLQLNPATSRIRLAESEVQP